MEVKQIILKEIDRVPNEYLFEILNFILFLETKSVEQKMELALMSESSLKKDWLKPEEDIAWEDL